MSIFAVKSSMTPPINNLCGHVMHVITNWQALFGKFRETFNLTNYFKANGLRVVIFSGRIILA